MERSDRTMLWALQDVAPPSVGRRFDGPDSDRFAAAPEFTDAIIELARASR